MGASISVVIPVRNEAANLPRCLENIAWADEVWVVDSGSVDGSQAIVAAEDSRRITVGSGRAHLVQFKFNGTWPKKKNWALENLPFTHEWVFILDADEVLPPSAEAEFRAVISPAGDGTSPLQNGAGAAILGYWINRRFMFMGKWLKHAYYPNWNLRLFKHRHGRYEKLTDADTASGDNEVHEHVVIRAQPYPHANEGADGSSVLIGPPSAIGHLPSAARTGRLRCEMDHYAFPSVDVFVEKHNRYSNWEARVAAERNLRRSASSLQSGMVGWRRRLKVLSHRLPFRPTLRFCYVYFWQRGFLDGVEGYYFARLHAMYELLCIAKQRELKRRGGRAGEVPR